MFPNLRVVERQLYFSLICLVLPMIQHPFYFVMNYLLPNESENLGLLSLELPSKNWIHQNTHPCWNSPVIWVAQLIRACAIIAKKNHRLTPTIQFLPLLV